MRMTELIGYIAASLTTIAFIPEAWLSWKSRRDERGVSVLMYLIFAAGVALWLAYGLLIGSWPVVCANAITLALALFILLLRLRRRASQAAARADASRAAFSD